MTRVALWSASNVILISRSAPFSDLDSVIILPNSRIRL